MPRIGKNRPDLASVICIGGVTRETKSSDPKCSQGIHPISTVAPGTSRCAIRDEPMTRRRAAFRIRMAPLQTSGENRPNYRAMHVRQTSLDAVVIVRQPFV